MNKPVLLSSREKQALIRDAVDQVVVTECALAQEPNEMRHDALMLCVNAAYTALHGLLARLLPEEDA